jgi:putative tryptophan/tyrosine transport system substrate-binding protein
LKEAVPRMARVGLLCTCSNPIPRSQYLRTTFAAAARTLGVQLQYIDVKDSTGLARALASTASANIGGLVVANGFGGDQEKQIAEFAKTHRLPAGGTGRGFAIWGGLISYGPKGGQSLGRMAAMVDKILKGAKPADLPVEGPTRYELVFNLKTAKALGLTIPPAVLARADEVIE